MTIKFLKLDGNRYINVNQITMLFIDTRVYYTSDNVEKTDYIVALYIPNDHYLCKVELAKFGTIDDAKSYLEDMMEKLEIETIRC